MRALQNSASPFLLRLFRFIVAKRWWVVGFYALLLGPAVYFALRVEQDNSLDRLIVQSDPDYIANRDFSQVFGGGDYVLLLAEARDPFAPEVLARLDAAERAIEKLPHVGLQSALSTFRRVKGGFQATPEQSAAFRSFANGTDIFRQQRLVGDDFLAMPIVIAGTTSHEARVAIGRIDEAISDLERHPAPLLGLRKVGAPYIDAYLDDDTRKASLRYFPLFGIFVVAMNLFLYRSKRALAAFLVALAVATALTVGYIGLTGGTFTIVSSLVPMTVLITCAATLVYVHSRFVEKEDPDLTVDEHQIFALANKFLACTASIFATAVGFAALAVSKIRPVREMGIWVAVGMGFTWLVVFTLFPALQKLFRTPTQDERKTAGQWWEHFVDRLPAFSYRYRWVLVPSSLVLCAAGVIALFGLKGVLPPMSLLTHPVDYLPSSTRLYQDTKRIEQTTAGLSLAEVWLRSPKYGAVTDPQTIRGLELLQRRLERDPTIGSAVGPTMIMRILRYVAGQGDQLPADDAGLEALTDQLEMLLAPGEGGRPREPLLASFIEPKQLAQTHISVVTRTIDYAGFQALEATVRRHFAEVVKEAPALKEFELQMTGLAPVQAKVAHYLVPTLVESFGLTVVIIFGTFLLVFRNGAARVMAMIPSLFAILVMFLFMRLFGVTLNAATILIASTVLGTSENDQVHFFYHYQEKAQGSPEERLRHTLRIAGRAIGFATLINAFGFLAFAIADLPPIRQFGSLSALAFALSMIADFTALPAALWLVFRARPDVRPEPPGQ